MNIGEQFIDFSASLGKTQSSINLIIGSIIGLVFLCIGIYLLSINQDNLVDTTATITASDCRSSFDRNNTVRYNCNLDVNYMVNDKNYTGKLSTADNIPHVNQSIINITYDKTNPQSITVQQPRSRLVGRLWRLDSVTSGIILIVICIIIIGLTWANNYFAQTSQAYAASQGMNTILNMGNNVFNPRNNQVQF